MSLKPLLASLFLLSSPSLVAEEDEIDLPAYEDMEDCCLPMETCCVEYECYMPAFYDEMCGSGRYLSFEYLYWYATEPGLSYSLTAVATPDSPQVTEAAIFIAPQEYNYLGTRWDSGIQVGLGRHASCDGWDSQLVWTYFRTKKHHTTSVPPVTNPNLGFGAPAAFEEVLINPWVNQSQTNRIVPLFFDTIEAEWKSYVQVLDLELGRKYWLSNCFVMRPFGGARGLYTKTKFETISSGSYEAGASSNYQDQFTNKTLGAGLIAGLQPSFYLGRNFALFGNFEGSLLWSKCSEKKEENYSLVEPTNPSFGPTAYSNQYSNKEYRMIAGVDLQAGLRWEVCWCSDQYRTAFDIGWDQRILFDLNKRNRIRPQFSDFNQGNTFESYDQLVTNLVLGGLIVRGQFDF